MPFVPNLQAMAIGGLAVAGVSGFFGYQFGFDHGLSHAAKEIAPVIKKKDGEISTLGTEKSQCRGEVDKINTANADLVAKNRAADEADQALRADANSRWEKILAQTSADARLAADRSEKARKAIENVADQCASAGVSPDVLRVLNDIFEPAPAGVRNGTMPARPGSDRP